jgi:hypothetical protein
MNDREESLQFDDVKRRLRPGDVFQATDHTWSRNGKKESRWRGTCPFCDCDNERVFSVERVSLRWHCHHCERGGGPLHYAAERENVGMGAHDNLKGETFFRAWEALSRHAGCEGPPDFGSGKSGGRKSSDRRPRRNRDRTRSRQPVTAGDSGNMSRDIPPRRKGSPQKTERKMKHSEGELREALVGYREALKTSDRARQYVEGRGLSVETLHAHGCGFAAPGEWIDDHITNDNGTHVHRAPNGRIVTPHTTPGGRLVCLSGRAVPPCPDWLKKRHVKGNDTALFNAGAIGGDSFATADPLVICEGPFDALSFIEVGHARTIAAHGKNRPPWEALRENVEAVVFAFDPDDEDAEEKATEFRGKAYWHGFDAHTLHDEDSYAGHGDPNDALQAGELTTGYLEALNGVIEDGTAEGAVAAADGNGPEAAQSPTSRKGDGGAAEDEPTAADLVPYWNGDNIGHLGRWLWERGGVPDGPVGPGDGEARDRAGGLYADRELHEWIEETLEAGPHGTTEDERQRLRRVLWRLYAAHGPEEVPERQLQHLIPDPAGEGDTSGSTRPEAAQSEAVWEERPRDPYRLGRLPQGVEVKRTAAPKDNPHPGQRGLAIDTPYSEAFIHDLKSTLPDWGRIWNGEAWVVDDVFAGYVGEMCRDHFGR